MTMETPKVPPFPTISAGADESLSPTVMDDDARSRLDLARFHLVEVSFCSIYVHSRISYLQGLETFIHIIHFNIFHDFSHGWKTGETTDRYDREQDVERNKEQDRKKNTYNGQKAKQKKAGQIQRTESQTKKQDRGRRDQDLMKRRDPMKRRDLVKRKEESDEREG